MIVTHKIMHYSEFLEKSRDSKYSKLEVKVHSNKTLKNPEVVSCTIYHNLYDTHKHIGVERGIRGSLLIATQNEDLPNQEREKAGGYLAYFNTGIMTWLPVKVWRNLMYFETVNEVNLSIPKEIKDFVKDHYTTEIKPLEL